MARPSALYLLCYNSLQSLGWAIALVRVLGGVVSSNSVRGTYASAGDLICVPSASSFLRPIALSRSLILLFVVVIGFLQTISFVEVVHAALGLVPSGVMLALMQWGGRTHFLLAILRQIPELQDLPSVFITFLAWSISEVIRYPHYALSCIGISLSWLTYLRYTAFVLLYPIGVAPGEMWLMYQALPFIKKRILYANFFDRLSISYYYFVLAVLICYPVLWLKLYLHLFKQRRSKLGRHQRKKEI